MHRRTRPIRPPHRGAALGLGLLCGGALLAEPPPARADAHDGVPLRVGVFLPYLSQPGGRATASYEIRLSASEADGASAWSHKLFVGPELGVFTRPDSHTSALAGGGIGYRLQSPGRCCFYELSVGVAYIAERHIESLDVELATGEITENRTLRHHALPAAHATFGLELLGRWGWYIDAAVGQTLSPEVPSALFFAAETGVQFRFDLAGQGAR